ncbi:MAG: helix-turn-helix transcriptional regulator [Bacteroidetes bacterium]|nr:helix-turn-helix transcriptional regulator [Bacteroidota bacterium]
MKRAKNESYGKKVVAESSCPVTFTMGKIGGKWKPVILYLVQKDCNRFGRLQKAIAGVSKQMLTAQLRELEQDGILDRIIFAEIPPRVEYKITKLGKTLFPIIESMREWGERRMKANP